jgi:serine/threonine-protein kinase
MPADVSRQLEAVVRKATAKRANERYPTVLAFRDALLEAAGPLPSRELFASHLSRLFPPDGEVRRARRQVLEKGLEDVRKSGGSAPASTTDSASPRPAVPGEAASSASAEPPSPGASAAARSAYEPPLTGETPLPQRPRWLVPFAVGGLVLALAAGAFLHQGRQSAPAAAPEDAGTSLAAAEPVDAGATVDAGAGDAGAVAAMDAGTPADGGALALLNRVAPASPEALLELVVEPQVDVSVDGRVLGRTPLNASLPPGKHVLYLNNPALGIQTARAVTLSLTERNLHEIQLLKGFIHLRAPSGAVVVLDGRNLGKAPIEQLDAYEGPHHLLVTLDGQNWEQSFQLAGAQHVTFTVTFDTEP